MTPLQIWLSGKGPESKRETGAAATTGQQDSSQQHPGHAATDPNGAVEQESWSSAIKSMVNSLRPTSSTRSPTRRASARHPTPPPSHLDSTSPQPPFDDNEVAETPTQSDRPSKRLKLTLKGPKLAAVPADVGDTNATIPSPRPPVKLTLSEPHGPLLQTTNGIRKTLNVTEDSIPVITSPSSTPALALNPEQRQTRKASERRSLRSHDEGPRLKSELAVYFPNYEEIIYDSNKESGKTKLNISRGHG
jgi:hypothetical protein